GGGGANHPRRRRAGAARGGRGGEACPSAGALPARRRPSLTPSPAPGGPYAVSGSGRPSGRSLRPGRFVSTGRFEKYFSFSHKSTGAATKIDEYVPTMMPMFMANAKFFTSPVPRRFIASVVMNVASDVRIVRDSVSLIEMLMTRSNFLSFSLDSFSRIRSNTTMVPFIE